MNRWCEGAGNGHPYPIFVLLSHHNHTQYESPSTYSLITYAPANQNNHTARSYRECAALRGSAFRSMESVVIGDSNDALPSTALAAQSTENTLDLNAVNAHMQTG